MKKQRILLFLTIRLVVAGLMLAGNIVPYPVYATPSSGEQIAIIESNPQTIIVELIVDTFDIEILEYEEMVFQRVHIPDMGYTTTEGAPQVPSRGVLLSVPSTENVMIQVIDADYEVSQGSQLYPAPKFTMENNGPDGLTSVALRETFYLDSELYSTDAFYPSSSAQLGEIGYMREQGVAQVQFYPVQHNPVRNETRIYSRIRVKVSWDSVAQAAYRSNRVKNPIYDGLLQHLVLNNDDIAGQPSTPASLTAARSIDKSWEAIPSPALKISVHEEGIYQLTHTHLSNAGFDPGTFDPRTIKMYHGGIELSILVSGEEDGVFDIHDYILFYGEKYSDRYTDSNIYWLSVGNGVGKRIQVRDGMTTNANAVPKQFIATLHAEADTAYWQNMPSRSGEDRWFWQSRISPNTSDLPKSRSYEIDLGTISSETAVATVRVRLKGYTSLAHHTQISINGQVIDEQRWQGQIPYTHSVNISQSLLKNGKNIVQIKTIDTGTQVDQILLNWIEIDYWDIYRAEENFLIFEAQVEGPHRFEISEFDDAAIIAFDITDAINPVQLSPIDIALKEDKYILRFNDNVHPANRYIALNPTQFKLPASVVLDEPSTWRSPNNGADYIIITHEDFYDGVQTLANHRRTMGMRVAIVQTGDLYDEFNDGIFNPRAIRDFLSYAYYNWMDPAPLYVVLIGDATQDYKDNLHTGTVNYVPTQTIESRLFGEVSSDNWFVAVSGEDILPDMFIGRLVAQNARELSDMVAKIIAYDQSPSNQTWNSEVLLVADDEAQFREGAERLATRLPHYYTHHRIYSDEHSSENSRMNIINQINTGKILVTYMGHGEYFGWGINGNANGQIFHKSDVDSLQNHNKLPVIVVGNCLNGFFASPKENSSLAETLQRKQQGGAIAVWAPTGLGYPTGHQELLEQFYNAIFVQDQYMLGAATTSAKLATYIHNRFWRDLVETYILFGDPATVIGIPTNYPYIQSTTPFHGAGEVPIDQAVQVRFNKPMDPTTFAIYSQADPDITFTHSWNDNFTMVNLASSGFEHDKTYQLGVMGQDSLGNIVGNGTVPNPWSFRITNENTPPDGIVTARGQDPASTLTTVVLSLSFTEPIRPESVIYTLSPFAKGILNLGNDKQKMTFISQEQLEVGETYTFTVLEAKDIAGNRLSKPFHIRFTVGETEYTYLPFIPNK